MYRTLLPLHLLLLATITWAQCPSSSCRFTFCDGSTTVTAGMPDTALSTAVCEGDIRLLGDASTKESMISGTPISQVEVDGQRFTPTFIKTFPIGNGGNNSVGVGHETPQEGQVAAIGDGLCVTLPFNLWTVMGANGTENRRMDTADDCLAFRLLPPENVDPSPGVDDGGDIGDGDGDGDGDGGDVDVTPSPVDGDDDLDTGDGDVDNGDATPSATPSPTAGDGDNGDDAVDGGDGDNVDNGGDVDNGDSIDPTVTPAVTAEL